MLDIRARRWWPPMLEELDLRERSLPDLLPTATPLGQITALAAAETGLARETLVVLGGFDQACAALGAGNVREGLANESTGTSLAVMCTVAQPPESPGNVPCHIHVVPERYFLCAHNPSGGSVLGWLRDEVAPDLSFADLDALAATVEPGCDGLVLLPYLSGTVTPAFDPAARGLLFGLTLRHERAHLVRAVLEGVAMACADLLDEARRLGVTFTEVRSVGGGARSDLWSQIKADVTGVPVRRVLAAEHAGSLGAAVLAGVGCGLLESVERGADELVRLGRTFEPDPRTTAAYAEARHVYRQLYPRVRDLFDVPKEPGSGLA
jgi:xylulokinase